MAKEPEQIELSSQEIESLHERIKSFTVTKEDMVLFDKVLSFFVEVIYTNYSYAQSNAEKLTIT